MTYGHSAKATLGADWVGFDIKALPEAAASITGVAGSGAHVAVQIVRTRWMHAPALPPATPSADTDGL